MMRSIAKLGLAAFGVVALMACSHDQTPANTAQTPASNPVPQQPNDPVAQNGILNGQTSPASSPTPQNPTFGTAGPQSPAFGDPSVQKPFGMNSDNVQNQQLAKSQKPLSDAEILGVVEAVNDGEVQMAEQATKKGTDKDIKSFAVMMKTMHSQGLAKAKSTETKTKITHADSDLSSFLKSDVAKTMTDLRDKSGHDFDKSYIDAQVTAHKNVLAAIDNRLIPGAENGEVKSLLTETRKVVVDHIAKAEEVQKKVSSVASTDMKGEDKASVGLGLDAPKSQKAKGIDPTP